MNVGARSLNSGPLFPLQVSGELRSLNAGADVLVCSRSLCVQPFVSVAVCYLQLLMSLIATMMAMITMSTTRMIRR